MNWKILATATLLLGWICVLAKPCLAERSTLYCVPDYFLGTNPSSGCCLQLTPNPGVTCSSEQNAEPSQTIVITCSGPDGSGGTYTIVHEETDENGLWWCSTTVEVTEPTSTS